MANKTLLKAVQDILLVAKDDEITALGETTSAELAEKALNDAWDELGQEVQWEYKQSFDTFAMPSPTTQPTTFTVPSDAEYIREVKFMKTEPTVVVDSAGAYVLDSSGAFVTVGHTAQQYTTLVYLEPDRFLEHLSSFTGAKTEDNVDEVTITTGSGTYKVQIANDAKPRYWTSLDGNATVVLDAYDKNDGPYLDDEKVLFETEREPAFPTTAAATFDIPNHFAPALFRLGESNYLLSIGRSEEAGRYLQKYNRLLTRVRNRKSIEGRQRIRFRPTRRGSI